MTLTADWVRFSDGTSSVNSNQTTRNGAARAKVVHPYCSDGTPAEIEVKFRIDPADRQKVLGSPWFAKDREPKVEKLKTVYFDTPGGDLRNNGVVLRMRRKGRDGYVLSLKFHGPSGQPFVRQEIELPSRGPLPQLDLLDGATATSLEKLIGKQPLDARFETQIQRRSLVIENGRSLLELAFDDGVISCGDLKHALLELELELKSGEEADLYDLALTLANDLPLRLDFVSKGERGFSLCEGDLPLPVRAESIEKDPGSTLDMAVTAVLFNTLKQFTANWAALQKTDQPEAVHQMRVALRRMRSALAMFKRVLPYPGFDALREQAQRLASALGSARECDVFLEDVRNGAFASPERPKAYEVLLAAAEDRRQVGYIQARSLLEAKETTLFVLEVQRLLASKTWRNCLPDSDLQVLTMLEQDFAKEVLTRLHVRACRRGKKLPQISDEDRHQLRITLKKLRYGAEFFGSAFKKRSRLKSFLRRIAELQDLLGAHNDIVTSRRFLDELTVVHGSTVDAAAGFILGWHARGIPLADARLYKAWKSFKGTPMFWR